MRHAAASRQMVQRANLMNLCHELADDRTKLESDAYFSFMKGNEGMECGDWVLLLVCSDL